MFSRIFLFSSRRLSVVSVRNAIVSSVKHQPQLPLPLSVAEFHNSGTVRNVSAEGLLELALFEKLQTLQVYSYYDDRTRRWRMWVEAHPVRPGATHLALANVSATSKDELFSFACYEALRNHFREIFTKWERKLRSHTMLSSMMVPGTNPSEPRDPRSQLEPGNEPAANWFYAKARALDPAVPIPKAVDLMLRNPNWQPAPEILLQYIMFLHMKLLVVRERYCQENKESTTHRGQIAMIYSWEIYLEEKDIGINAGPSRPLVNVHTINKKQALRYACSLALKEYYPDFYEKTKGGSKHTVEGDLEVQGITVGDPKKAFQGIRVDELYPAKAALDAWVSSLSEATIRFHTVQKKMGLHECTVKLRGYEHEGIPSPSPEAAEEAAAAVAVADLRQCPGKYAIEKPTESTGDTSSSQSTANAVPLPEELPEGNTQSREKLTRFLMGKGKSPSEASFLTVQGADMYFVSTCTIFGKKYTGKSASKKKQAEWNATELACRELQVKELYKFEAGTSPELTPTVSTPAVAPIAPKAVIEPQEGTSSASTYNPSDRTHITSLDMFARLRVGSYIKAQTGGKSPVLKVEPVEGGKLHRAKLKVPLPGGVEKEAEGFAATAKNAELCALMHAEDLLNEMRVPLFADATKQAAYEKDKKRKVTSPALPLWYNDSPVFQPTKKSSVRDGLAAIYDVTAAFLSLAPQVTAFVTEAKKLDRKATAPSAWGANNAQACLNAPETILEYIMFSKMSRMEMGVAYEMKEGTRIWSARVLSHPISNPQKPPVILAEAKGTSKITTTRVACIQALTQHFPEEKSQFEHELRPFLQSVETQLKEAPEVALNFDDVEDPSIPDSRAKSALINYLVARLLDPGALIKFETVESFPTKEKHMPHFTTECILAGIRHKGRACPRRKDSEASAAGVAYHSCLRDPSKYGIKAVQLKRGVDADGRSKLQIYFARNGFHSNEIALIICFEYGQVSTRGGFMNTASLNVMGNKFTSGEFEMRKEAEKDVSTLVMADIEAHPEKYTWKPGEVLKKLAGNTAATGTSPTIGAQPLQLHEAIHKFQTINQSTELPLLVLTAATAKGAVVAYTHAQTLELAMFLDEKLMSIRLEAPIEGAGSYWKAIIESLPFGANSEVTPTLRGAATGKTKPYAIRMACLSVLQSSYPEALKLYDDTQRSRGLAEESFNRSVPTADMPSQEADLTCSGFIVPGGKLPKDFYDGDIMEVAMSVSAPLDTVPHAISERYIRDTGRLSRVSKVVLDAFTRSRAHGTLDAFIRMKEGVCQDGTTYVYEAMLDLGDAAYGSGYSKVSRGLWAIGQATRKRDAILACCMHAQLIFDAIGIPIMSSTYQDEYANNVIAHTGRWAPTNECMTRPNAVRPLPLRVQLRDGAPSIIADDGSTLFQGATQEVSAEPSTSNYISDLSLLNSTSKSRLARWWTRRQGTDAMKEMRMIVSGNLFQASLKIPLGEELGDRVAIGIAFSQMTAQEACTMHAELIMDAVGVPICTTRVAQDEHAANVITAGRWAPTSRCPLRPTATLPPPVRVKKPEALNIDTSSFRAVQELREDRTESVYAFFARDDSSSTPTVKVEIFRDSTLGEGEMYMTTVTLPLKDGDRIARGASAGKLASCHLAFQHAHEILEIYVMDPDNPGPSPYIMHGSVTARRQKSKPAEMQRDIPEPIEEDPNIFAPDPGSEYIYVRQKEVSIKDPKGICAIRNLRETVQHSSKRIPDLVLRMAMRRGQVLTDPPLEEGSEVQAQNSSGVFRTCKLKLELPHPFPTLESQGQGRTIKCARVLCYMHMELQLDALGFPLFNDPNRQYEHALDARNHGRNVTFESDERKATPRTLPKIPVLRKYYENDEYTKSIYDGLARHEDPLYTYSHAPKTTFISESFDNLPDFTPQEKRRKKEERKQQPVMESTSILPDGITFNDINPQHFTLNVRVPRKVIAAYVQRMDPNRRLEDLLRFSKGGVASDGSALQEVTCVVPMPEPISEQLAVGVARLHQDAEHLCFFHFKQILDAFNVPINDTNEHHKLKKNAVVPAAARMKILTRPLAPTEPDAIQLADLDIFSDYIELCKAYIADIRRYNTLISYAQHKSPEYGDKLMDDALRESEKGQPEPHAKTILYNFCVRVGIPPARFSTKQVQSTYVTEATLQGFEWVAKGTGPTDMQSTRRAAMHCIEILRRTHPEFNPETDLASRIKRQQIEKTASKSSLSAWMGNVLSQLGYKRLVEMYVLCNDLDPPTLRTHQTQTGSYAATLALREGDVVHTGEAEYGNERVAEEMVVENLCLAMKAEPKFAALVALFRQNPMLDPNHVFNVEVEDWIRGHIESVCELVDSLDAAAAGPVEVEKPAVWRRPARPSSRETPSLVSPAMVRKRQSLPMYGAREEILAALRVSNAVVICGTTGSGKTTQVPQYILEDALAQGKGTQCFVAVTQPRRITAISVAQRVAEERGERVGESVGYSVRFESRPGSHINYFSSGVLLRVLESNPMLDGVSHVVVDEVHERDINADFVMLVLRRLLRVRSDLKVVIMSATLSSQTFSQYFGGAPIVNVDQAMHPVEIYHLEDIVAQARASGTGQNVRAIASYRPPDSVALEAAKVQQQQLTVDYSLVVYVIRHSVGAHSMATDGGSILVFLPGWSEIQRTRDALESSVGAQQYHVICLHSSVNPTEQMACFQPAPHGRVKLILSTNIAESGVTIDDVVVVIDAGMMKEKRIVQETEGVHASSLSQLVCVRASKANVAQRKGRTGRTRRGYCYRLFAKAELECFADFQTPEIQRLPLESLCLSILNQGIGMPVNVLRNALDPPPPEKVEEAMRQLRNLGAVGEDGLLTGLGRHIARFPAAPATGKMVLLGVALGCLDTALTLAADTDPFRPSGEGGRDNLEISREVLCQKKNSDQYSVLNAYNKWAALMRSGTTEERQQFLREYSLYEPLLHTMSQAKRQLYDELVSIGFITEQQDHTNALVPTSHRKAFVDTAPSSRNSDNYPFFEGLIAASLFPNVAMFTDTKDVSTMQLRGGYHRGTFRSKVSDVLKIPFASVVKVTSETPSPFVVYREKVQAVHTSAFSSIREVTAVGLWTLLLFGTSRLHFSFREDLNLCVIDDWIILKMTQEVYDMILKLKRGLEICMELHPAVPSASREDLKNKLQVALRLLVPQVVEEEVAAEGQLTSETEPSVEGGGMSSGAPPVAPKRLAPYQQKRVDTTLESMLPTTNPSSLNKPESGLQVPSDFFDDKDFK